MDWKNMPVIGQAQYYDPRQAQAQAASTKTKKKEDNLLASLLPMGGGIAGAAGGAALGAGIGSVVPVIGTGIGGLLGALIGGAAGGGGGKVAENAIEGNKNIWEGVPQEAALSGIMGAGPLRLGKAAIDTVRGVKAGAGLTEALTKAGTNAVEGSITGKLGEKLTNASNDLAVKDFRLTPTQLNNFSTKYGEDASQVIKRYGLTGKDAFTIKNNVINPLQGEFDSLVTQLPKISKNDLAKAFEAKYKPLLNHAVEDNRAIGQQLKRQADTVLSKFDNNSKRLFVGPMGQAVDNSIDISAAQKRVAQIDDIMKNAQTKGGITGNEARNLMSEKQTLQTAISSGEKADQFMSGNELNSLRREFDKLVNYTEKASNSARYKVNKRSADVLRSTLQTAADNAGIKSSQGMTFKDVGNELSKLRQLTKNVGKQEQLGRGNLPVGLGNAPGAIIGSVGGVPGALVGYAANGALNSSTGRRLMASGTEKLGNKLTQKAAETSPYGIGEVAKRVVPVGLAGALMNDQSLGGKNISQNANTTSIANPIPNASNMDQLYNNVNSSASSASANPYPRENMLADIQRDPKNAQDYMKYYQTMQEVYAAPEATQLTASQQKTAVTAQNALGDIQVIQDAVNSGDIDKGLVPFSDNAIVGNVLGTNNINAALFNVADVILRSRTGAAAPPEEVKKFLSGYMPRAGESKETQLYKLQRAYNELAGMVNPAQALGVGTANADLGSVLSSLQ